MPWQRAWLRGSASRPSSPIAKLEFEVHSDATAAIGIASRQGLGRIRHIAVADLWVQERIKRGDARVHKVAGKENPSDPLTKPLDADLTREHLVRMGVHNKKNGGADKAGLQRR